MKQFKFIFASLMAMLTLAILPSCSDNKDEPSVPAAKTIQGSYAGDMECSVMGSASTFENLTFSIEATDDATVAVTLPAFGEAPMAMPSLAITGVKVTEQTVLSHSQRQKSAVRSNPARIILAHFPEVSPTRFSTSNSIFNMVQCLCR